MLRFEVLTQQTNWNPKQLHLPIVHVRETPDQETRRFILCWRQTRVHVFRGESWQAFRNQAQTSQTPLDVPLTFSSLNRYKVWGP